MLLLCGCMQSASTPPSDECDVPSTAGIEAVELGAASLDSLFEPWNDDDVIPIVRDTQSVPMLLPRLRVHGTSTGCIAQHTRVTSATGMLILDDDTDLRVYPQDDGSYLTETHHLRLSHPFPGSGARVTVHTQVGTTTSTCSVWLDAPYQGPPLAAIQPASIDMPAGTRLRVAVLLSAPATTRTVVLLHTSDPAIATVEQPDITIAPGETRGTAVLWAGMPGGPVKLIATVGDAWLDVPVTVQSR